MTEPQRQIWISLRAISQDGDVSIADHIGNADAIERLSFDAFVSDIVKPMARKIYDKIQESKANADRETDRPDARS